MKISTFLLGTAHGLAIGAIIGPAPNWSVFGLAVLAGLMMAIEKMGEPAGY